jgi:formamidopyrimidine-DNA glycosylase
VPELPEVEATRLGLIPHLAGRHIEGVAVLHPRVVRRQHRPVDFSDRLVGRRIMNLDRLGKFLLVRLDADLQWVTHLGMSGRLHMVDAGSEIEIHTRATVVLTGGRELRFVDPRTFGFMSVWTDDEFATSSVARLGRDAHTDLPGSRELAGVLRGRTAPIKALLLDQGIVAGVGNIYADETLHRARIAPLRAGNTLTIDEVKRLRAGVRASLTAGIAAGGTSLEDLAYLLPDGRAGQFFKELRAYGREGKPCRRCGEEIRRTVIRGRSSFWCPDCQT